MVGHVVVSPSSSVQLRMHNVHSSQTSCFSTNPRVKFSQRFDLNISSLTYEMV
jgi:hypothetical protein